MYNLGESSMKRISSLVSTAPRASAYHMQRRTSEDSEKGLDLLEDESSSVGTTRASTDVDDVPRRGKYYGAWTGGKEDDGYFSLPPTPPEGEIGGEDEKQLAFGEALARAGKGGFASLPTPALSAHSLSHAHAPARSWGWWSNLIARLQWDAKTGAVVRELGWTVAVLVIGFCVTLGMVVAFLGGLPM
jgi:hypothetical protein